MEAPDGNLGITVTVESVGDDTVNMNFKADQKSTKPTK